MKLANQVTLVLLSICILFFNQCQRQNLIDSILFDVAPIDTFLMLQINDLKALNSSLKNYNNFKQLTNISPDLKKAVQHISPTEINPPLLYFFSSEGKNEIVTSLAYKVDENRDLELKTDKTFPYEGEVIQQLATTPVIYTTQFGEIQFLTSSKLVIESVIRNYGKGYDGINSYNLDRLFLQRDSQAMLHIFFKRRGDKLIKNLFPAPSLYPNSYGEWTLLNIDEKGIQLEKEKIGLFDQLKLNELHIVEEMPTGKTRALEICPDDTQTLFSFLLPNYKTIEVNFKTYSNHYNLEVLEIDFRPLEEVREITFLKNKEHFASIFHLSKPKEIDPKLLNQSNPLDYINQYPIHNVELPNDILTYLKVFGLEESPRYGTLIDDYLILAKNRETIKYLIQKYVSKQTLDSNAHINQISTTINKSLSYLWLAKTNYIIEQFAEKLDIEQTKVYESMVTVNTPFTIMTGSVSGEALVTKTLQPMVNLEQTFSQNLDISIELNNPAMSKASWLPIPTDDAPNTFMIQDTLTLLNEFTENGQLIYRIFLDDTIQDKVSHSKKGNNEITSAIRTASRLFLFNNTTQDHQELSINRVGTKNHYLTSLKNLKGEFDSHLLISDTYFDLISKSGERLRAIDYNIKSPLKFSPKQLFINDRSYLIFQYLDDNVEIVNTRTWTNFSIPDSITLATNPVFVYGDKPAFINTSGNIIVLNSEQSISEIPAYIKDFQCIVSLDKQLIYTSDESITIGSKTISLPEGDYQCPRTHSNEKGDYIGVFDSGNHRYYLFKKNGNLLDGFPIYSRYEPDLIYDASSDSLKILGVPNLNIVNVYRVD